MSVVLNATNFPDENFRSCIANKLGLQEGQTITDEMILNFTRLGSTTSEMSQLGLASSLEGIKYFVNLQHLGYSQTVISPTNLDLSNMPNLEILYFSLANIESLNIKGCSKLRTLGIQGRGGILDYSILLENLSSYDVSQTGRRLYLDNISILPKYLDLNTFNGFDYVEVENDNVVETLRISSTTKHIYPYAMRKLENLDLSPGINTLNEAILGHIGSNQMSEEDVMTLLRSLKNFTALNQLNITIPESYLDEEIDFSEYQSDIKHLRINSLVKQIDLTRFRSSLEILEIYSHELKDFDLSNFQKLYTVRLNGRGFEIPKYDAHPSAMPLGNFTMINAKNSPFLAYAIQNRVASQGQLMPAVGTRKHNYHDIRRHFTSSTSKYTGNFYPGDEPGTGFTCLMELRGAGAPTTYSDGVAYNVESDLLYFTQKPQTVKVHLGDTAVLECAAAGSGNIKYQWEICFARTNCASILTEFRPIGNPSDDGTYTTKISSSLPDDDILETHVRWYRCRAYRDDDSANWYSEWSGNVDPAIAKAFDQTIANYETRKYPEIYTFPVQIIVVKELRPTSQPQSINVLEGQLAIFSFTAQADDSSVLSYQWQKKLNGSDEFNDIVGEISETLSFAAELNDNGQVYRCVVTDLDTDESIVSNEATLTVIAKTAPIITNQPESQSVIEGQECIFSIVAESYNDLSYRWQISEEGSDEWEEISGENTNTLLLLATSEMSGNKYRCIVTNDIGDTTSEEAILTTLEDLRTVSPNSLTVIEGNTATFEVNHYSSDLSYQWQVSTNNGETWTDLRYYTSFSIEIATSLFHNNKYRCVITNSLNNTIFSSPATLTVTADQSLAPPTITTQPSSLEITEGNNATFSVVASGNNLSYQWQTYKNGTWYNINGANSASYTTLASTSLNGNQYRCQVSNAAGSVYSNTAILTVTSSAGSISTPSINTQPRSTNVNDGQTAIFSLTANGGGLSYQWYIKRNGQWYPISGAANAIYSVIGRSANNGTQYRCLVTNSAGSVYSNVVDLNVQSSAPLSFYGYHSIIISGKNTYGEWEMYPTSRPHVAPPEVKTSYVDVPGADGGLDYTDLLTGEPRFGYRKGSWEFLLIPQERWPDVYRSLCNFLNGRVHTVVLEDDPNWQYTGRLSVNKWESAAHNSLITIDYILDPNPVNLDDESYSTDDDDLAAAARILRKPGNEGMVIGMFNGSATVVDPAIYFEDGDNISY